MKINLSFAMCIGLLLAACGSPSEVPAPVDAVGMEAPSDTPSRNARLTGRWLSTAKSMPAGAIRMEISSDGTYRMKMLQARDSLVETIVSASAGDISWNRAGFAHGVDGHPSPDMARFGRWTAGFANEGATIVLAPEKGAPVLFDREPES